MAKQMLGSPGAVAFALVLRLEGGFISEHGQFTAQRIAPFLPLCR
ncbi:MAG: hypothetical protein ACLQKK_16190 [Rhodomicrobium sp.]